MWADLLIYPILFAALYFEVFMLMSFAEGKHTRSIAAGTPSRYPSVTIFVPCYNEEKTVSNTLDSLLALDYPEDKLSIFAINDGSTDGTLLKLKEYESRTRIRVFSKENGGKHSALNFGLTHASSELVGCLDADSYVAPNALSEMVRYFEDTSIMAATPAIKIANPRTFVERVQHAEYAVSAFVRRTLSWLDSLFITPGPFSLFRKEVFDILGPYKAAYNTEDMEIALRLQKAGMRIENVPTAHVYTTAPRTYATLFRQRVRWTYGFMKNASDYRGMFFNRRYGTLGLFILPFGLLTIFPPIILTAIALWYGGAQIAQAAERISVVGFTMPHLSFDWFFIDTRASFVLMLALIALTLATIIIGKRLTDEKRLVDWNVALYLILYGFMAPWWLARASYNVLVSKERTWASEIDARRKHG